jgi:hypothetical protein
VITISGLFPNDKDNVANLCKHLGAHVQSSLSVKDTAQYKRNTHLICNQASGPKYEAARNWKMPIVFPEWAVESCVTGMKAEESKYSVESGVNTHSTQLIEALSKIRINCDDTGMFTNSMCATNEISMNGGASSYGSAAAAGDVSMNTRQMMMMMSQGKENAADLSSPMAKYESKKPRLDQEDNDTGNLYIKILKFIISFTLISISTSLRSFEFHSKKNF